jgi:hypothetical protein
MKTFVKRLQTRASRKGIRVSMQQVRDAYQSVVTDLENPTDEEMEAVLTKLESSSEEGSELVPIPQPEIIEITPESNPDLWEILQPPSEPEESAIAVDQAEPETETSNKVVQIPSEESLEVQPNEEVTYSDRSEPQRALTKTDSFTLQEPEKRSLIQQQASSLSVELDTAELTTVASNIADNYSSFEDACRNIQSIILMVLDQRFERASGVLDDTLLTILNRASGNFQALNGRASQGFTAIANELQRVDSDFKSQSTKLESNLKQYLLK